MMNEITKKECVGFFEKQDLGEFLEQYKHELDGKDEFEMIVFIWSVLSERISKIANLYLEEAKVVDYTLDFIEDLDYIGREVSSLNVPKEVRRSLEVAMEQVRKVQKTRKEKGIDPS